MVRPDPLRHWPAQPGRELKKWEELLPARVGWPLEEQAPLVWHARIEHGQPAWVRVEVAKLVEVGRGRPCGALLRDGTKVTDRRLLRWAPGGR